MEDGEEYPQLPPIFFPYSCEIPLSHWGLTKEQVKKGLPSKTFAKALKNYNTAVSNVHNSEVYDLKKRVGNHVIGYFDETDCYVLAAIVGRNRNQGMGVFRSYNSLATMLAGKVRTNGSGEEVFCTDHLFYYESDAGELNLTEMNGGVVPFLPESAIPFDTNVIAAAKICEMVAEGNMDKQLISNMSQFLGIFRKANIVQKISNFCTKTTFHTNDERKIPCLFMFSLHNANPVTFFSAMNAGAFVLHSKYGVQQFIVDNELEHEKDISVLFKPFQPTEKPTNSKKRSQRGRKKAVVVEEEDEDEDEDEDDEEEELVEEQAKKGKRQRADPSSKPMILPCKHTLHDIVVWSKMQQFPDGKKKEKKEKAKEKDSKSMEDWETSDIDPILHYLEKGMNEEDREQCKKEARKSFIHFIRFILGSQGRGKLFSNLIAGVDLNAQLCTETLRGYHKGIKDDGDFNRIMESIGPFWNNLRKSIERYTNESCVLQEALYIYLLWQNQKDFLLEIIKTLSKDEQIQRTLHLQMKTLSKQAKDDFEEENGTHDVLFSIVWRVLDNLIRNVSDEVKKIAKSHAGYILNHVTIESMPFENLISGDIERLNVPKGLEKIFSRIPMRGSFTAIDGEICLCSVFYNQEKNDLNLSCVKLAFGKPEPVYEDDPTIRRHLLAWCKPNETDFKFFWGFFIRYDGIGHVPCYQELAPDFALAMMCNLRSRQVQEYIRVPDSTEEEIRALKDAIWDSDESKAWRQAIRSQNRSRFDARFRKYLKKLGDTQIVSRQLVEIRSNEARGLFFLSLLPAVYKEGEVLRIATFRLNSKANKTKPNPLWLQEASSDGLPDSELVLTESEGFNPFERLPEDPDDASEEEEGDDDDDSSG